MLAASPRNSDPPRCAGVRVVGVMAIVALFVVLAAPLRVYAQTVMVPMAWPGYDPHAALAGTDGETGELRYRVTRNDGSTESVSAEEFARRTLDYGTLTQQPLGGPQSGPPTSQRSALERLFNATGPAEVMWVVFGLAGQVVFAGRMVVQWLVSERRQESVVPPVFWWMSLVGASMLLAYFLWRQDIVGILGQSLGFVIYVRNLTLIRRAQARLRHTALT